MMSFPLVFCCVRVWCMSCLGVLQNNKVELAGLPWTSYSPLLCTGGLDSTVMVNRRILCLETQ
jgi:hypothetical protein